jgi:hypothetical protein
MRRRKDGEEMKTGPRADTAPLLWLGLVLCIALAIAFLLPVTPQDYWWYLRIGHDTVTAGALPRLDTLSNATAGSPMVNYSWAAAVLFWLIYKLGGLTLTVLLRGLLVTAAYALVWLTARRLGAGRVGAGLALLLAVLASSNNWSMRPQLFAYPLFALALYILTRWQKGERNSVFWLPLISLLWANLHGSFLMLLLLAGAGLVFGCGDKRRLAIAFAGSVLVTLVNPRGFALWTDVFHLLTLPAQQFSAEWNPPLNHGWQMNIFFTWLLAFPLLVAFSPRKLDALEWTWFVGFGFLALRGERYVIWFVLILMLLTSLMLADWEKRILGEPKQGSPGLNVALCLALILLPLALLPGIRERWWQEAPAATERTPIAATSWLASHPELPGSLWAEIGFASYLEYALPSRPPWIDSRFIPFSVEQMQAYKDITDARYDWSSLLQDTGANLLMVSTLDQPSLQEALSVSVDWCSLYRDDLAVIYRRGACQP